MTVRTSRGAELTVTDAQVHVWAPPRRDRPWAPGGESYADGVDNLSSAERPPLGPDDLLAEMRASGVDRVVLVPPTFEGDRNDLALAAAAAHPDRFAVMGRIAVDDPASRALLPTWLDQPGMRGVRVTFHWGRQRRWLHDGTADWLWAAAEEAGVPVAVYPPGALDRIAVIASRHPDLRLIVDHFALALEARDDDIPPVVDDLRGLAVHPNVAVKASALPSYTRGPYPFERLHEPIRRVVEAFGPRRVFWGSEMTRLPCPYRQAVSLFTHELDFLTDDDLRWVMGRGVEEWIGWAPSAAAEAAATEEA